MKFTFLKNKLKLQDKTQLKTNHCTLEIIFSIIIGGSCGAAEKFTKQTFRE